MGTSKKPSQEAVQAYLADGMKKLAESPSSLSKTEKRLLTKLKKTSDAAQQVLKDIQNMKGQISQAEARLRSLELQSENHQGAANAFVDELVSLKFDTDGLEEVTEADVVKEDTAARV